MTIRAMYLRTRRARLRAVGAFAALACAGLLFGACGTGEGSLEADDQAAIDAAAASAAEALDAISALEDEVADLRSDLAGAKSASDDARAQVEEVADWIWKSMKKVRASIAGVRARSDESVGAVSARAEDAIARVEAAVRQLSVVSDRLDYHLATEHGGG